MQQPLPARSCLDIEVSCVKNYYSKAAVNVNLLIWLRTEKYRHTVERLRGIKDKPQRDKLKASLPAITPSGLFSFVKQEGLKKHTGFIQFDIDLKDNLHLGNYDTLHRQLRNITNIAYCGLSLSGQGYWGLVRIGYPDRHEQHWEYLNCAMKRLNIHIDPAPKNVCSLRGASYDPNAYYNHHANKMFTYIAPPGQRRYMQHIADIANASRVNRLLDVIDKKKTDVTDTYRAWFCIGCNFAATFGEHGREYFHRASCHYPGYNTRHCDYQYNQCMNYVLMMKTQPGLGYFTKRCTEKGVD